jgi:flagellar motor protein MotB
MAKKQKNEIDKSNEDGDQRDDYQEYLKEMEKLKSDFSDLEDLDPEEIQAMKEGIEKVKEAEFLQLEEEPEIEDANDVDVLEEKEELMIDFSDMGKMDLEELLEMKRAVDMVKEDESSTPEEEKASKSSSTVSDELEKKIEDELKKKQEKEEKLGVITEEDFLKYVKQKRDKIWYHALYFLAFEIEDHTASKDFLYEMLKEDTSKSAIDPIPQHQFYFGLGYLLRLKMNKRQIIRYLPGGKFKINADIKKIEDILQEAGEPIITKPTLEEEKKKQMFRDFLKDDFSDI